MQGLFALSFHAVGVAASCSGTYFGEALLHPENLRTVYLPAMVWDEGRWIFDAMRAERVTWYRCPNGHLYSIGECGGPVQATRCTHPGCNRPIGGINHVPAAGNVRLGTFHEMQRHLQDSAPGYNLADRYDHVVQRIGYSLSTESVCFHRLILHLVLLAGAEMRGSSQIGIARRLGTPEVFRRLEVDFLRLKIELGWTTTELILALHFALDRLEVLLSKVGGLSDTDTKCAHFEEVFDEEVIRPTFLMASSRRAVIKQMDCFQTSVIEGIVREQLGDARWALLQQEGANDQEWQTEASSAVDKLWRLRPRASFDDLCRCFQRRGAATSTLQLLTAFLRNEERLPLTGLLADILGWHRLVYRSLGSEPITREEAAQRTNEDVLKGLPAEDREAAAQALQNFCDAFNTVLPKLSNLFECQRNPFLTDDGRIDLSGTSAGRGPEAESNPMTGSTPLHFTLPSHPPGPLADAPGLCTIQILNYLVRSHNEVCQELAELGQIVVAARRRAAEVGETTIVDAAVANATAVVQDDAALTVGAEMPPDVLRRRLLTYNRDRDLLPLLFEFSNQSLGWGPDAGLIYDLEGLESAIAGRVFAGKRTLALHIRHYLYAGEARARGTLAALQGVLPQAPALPGALGEAVRIELDTREQVMRFLGLLEEAMRFLVAVGVRPSSPLSAPSSSGGAAGAAGAAAARSGDGEDGAVLLFKYLRDVAMVEGDRLNAGLPPLIAQQASLPHLRVLFLAAEAKLTSPAEGSSGVCAPDGGGVLLPSVLPAYRAELPDKLGKQLNAACGKCAEMAGVLPVLRDLLTGALSDQAASFGASESLRDFLVYEDSDLEREPWFVQLFPPELRLGHALEAFRVLVSRFAEQG